MPSRRRRHLQSRGRAKNSRFDMTVTVQRAAKVYKVYKGTVPGYKKRVLVWQFCTSALSVVQYSYSSTVAQYPYSTVLYTAGEELSLTTTVQ